MSATALTASDDASKMKRWFARKSNYPTRCTRGPSRSARPGRYRWPSSPGEESNTSSAFMHPIRTPAATMEIGKIQETQGGDPSTMIRFLVIALVLATGCSQPNPTGFEISVVKTPTTDPDRQETQVRFRVPPESAIQVASGWGKETIYTDRPNSDGVFAS